MYAIYMYEGYITEEKVNSSNIYRYKLTTASLHIASHVSHCPSSPTGVRLAGAQRAHAEAEAAPNARCFRCTISSSMCAASVKTAAPTMAAVWCDKKELACQRE